MAEQKANSDTPAGKSTQSAKATAAKKEAQDRTDKAGRQAAETASKTGSSAQSAAVAAKSHANSAGSATRRAGQAAAHSAEAGRQKLTEVSGKATAAAAATWTVVKARKALVGGAGAGLATVVTASYLAGRSSAKRGFGPVTRLTSGRI